MKGVKQILSDGTSADAPVQLKLPHTEPTHWVGIRGWEQPPQVLSAGDAAQVPGCIFSALHLNESLPASALYTNHVHLMPSLSFFHP